MKAYSCCFCFRFLRSIAFWTAIVGMMVCGWTDVSQAEAIAGQARLLAPDKLPLLNHPSCRPVDDAQLQVLQSLRTRQDALDRHEEALRRWEADLAAWDRRLQPHLATLSKRLDALELSLSLQGDSPGERRARLDLWVRALDALKPAKVAAILADVPVGAVGKILPKLQSDHVGQVLNHMPAAMVASLLGEGQSYPCSIKEMVLNK